MLEEEEKLVELNLLKNIIELEIKKKEACSFKKMMGKVLITHQTGPHLEKR